MIKLTWYGHACFKLNFNDECSVVFDPYSKGSVPGVELPEGIVADEALCSHDHGDHNAVDRIGMSGRLPDYSLQVIYSYHDDARGVKRGTNKIHIVSRGGFKMAHFGDQGCELNEAQYKKLEGLDLALIPVGGHFTIDAKQAKALTEQIKPRIIIPMHYRSGDMGFNVLADIEELTSLFDNPVYCDGNELTLDENMRGVYVLKP